MTLEQLRMLVAVAEYKSLKTASEALFKTQSALSQGLKQLEQQLGIQLLDRSNYRLELTSHGRQIHQQALRILNETSKLQQLATHFSQGNEEQIVLAIEASFDMQKLLPILQQAQKDYPDTQIIIRQEYMSGAVSALQHRSADIALTPYVEELVSGITFSKKELYRGSFINVISPQLLHKHQPLNDLSQLINEYQILVRDSGSHSEGQDYGVQTGQRRWYVSDFNTKKTMILSGMGWGRLPSSFITKELETGELVRLETGSHLPQSEVLYCALTLPDKALGPIASKLWEKFGQLSH